MVTAEIDKISAEQQKYALAKLLVEDPDTRKRLKNSIRTVINKVRKSVSQDIRGNLENDPRKTYLAVKRSIYKKILGGNVSILNSRRAGRRAEIIRQRQLDQHPHQRGGNRRLRSADTENVDSYYGKDRGFILRFLNSGTDERKTRYGTRGAISPRLLFERPALSEMDKAAEILANSFLTELEAGYNKALTK